MLFFHARWCVMYRDFFHLAWFFVYRVCVCQAQRFVGVWILFRQKYVVARCTVLYDSVGGGPLLLVD